MKFFIDELVVFSLSGLDIIYCCHNFYTEVAFKNYITVLEFLTQCHVSVSASQLPRNVVTTSFERKRNLVILFSDIKCKRKLSLNSQKM